MKAACLALALLFGFGGILGVSTLHVPRFEPNEIAVAITQAALDATYPPTLPWPPVLGPKKPKPPTVRIPSDLDPDRI